MYASLKDWVNIPFYIRTCAGKTTAGDKTLMEPVQHFCYAEDKVKVVVNNEGIETISTITLYMEQNIAIDYDDEVIYNGKQRVIKAIGNFYDNSDGNIKLVYL